MILNYTIQKQIKQKRKELKGDFSIKAFLVDYIELLSTIKNHYLNIIEFMQNISDNTNSCYYDNIKTEIKSLNENLNIIAEFKDMAFIYNEDNDLKTWLEKIKVLKAEIEDLKFKQLCHKKDNDKMVIYDYDRYILNMSSNKNYFDREIKRLKKMLFKLLPQKQKPKIIKPFCYSRFFKDNHTIQ